MDWYPLLNSLRIAAISAVVVFFAVEAAVEERMEKAYQFALDAPLPDPADVLKYNYACDNERSVAR